MCYLHLQADKTVLSYNAIVVAGGRSTRLGGTPKALLSNGSVTLLQSTLAAVAHARSCIVVGPDDLPLPEQVHLTREAPPFGGPAAALAAGARFLATLGNSVAPWTFVLSVDMPHVAQVLPVLSAAAEQAPDALGFMGEAEGILQPLTGLYRTQDLIQAATADLHNKSVRALLGPLTPLIVQLPPGSAADVDTWEQARSTGFSQPTASSLPHSCET